MIEFPSQMVRRTGVQVVLYKILASKMQSSSHAITPYMQTYQFASHLIPEGERIGVKEKQCGY